jgi:predicted Zn-dependent protease
MAFRFWRRAKVLPGVTLNLSKSGGSLSFGPRGAKYTISPRGRRTSVGIPGTGLFYTSRGSGRRADRRTAPPMPEVPPDRRLTLGFFRRLVTPKREEALVDGCRELLFGEPAAALEHFRRAAELADGAFLAGVLALKAQRLAEAERHLSAALGNAGRLGKQLEKYGMSALISLPITEEVAAHVEPDERGVLLALAEVYQHQGHPQEAADCLRRLQRLEPSDVVVKLSLAELLLEAGPEDRRLARHVVGMAAEVENETPVHTALLLYKARALRVLGMLEAARDALTAALRRRKDRSAELRRAPRYERALLYEAMGNKRRARSDLERLYAEAPGYEDVARRLGV